MNENEHILQTIKATIQDIVAPDVRELKIRMTSLEDQMEIRFEAMMSQSDLQFQVLLAAISRSKAEFQLSTYKQIASLSERVSALEAHRP